MVSTGTRGHLEDHWANRWFFPQTGCDDQRETAPHAGYERSATGPADDVRVGSVTSAEWLAPVPTRYRDFTNFTFENARRDRIPLIRNGHCRHGTVSPRRYSHAHFRNTVPIGSTFGEQSRAN
jgi:hypothetical protein